MKHWINQYICLLWSCLLLWSCNDEELFKQSELGEPVDVVLNFGAAHNEQIEIKTRATYAPHYESMVRNIYAFVFANGNKIYGHYFGTDDLNKTNERNYWTVTNMSSTNNVTKGKLHMSVPSVSQGAEIILIANFDLDFMNLSQERLGSVRTKSDLNQLVVSLNQAIPDRNAGYFMMTGSQDGVTIASNGTITIPNNTPIMLHRLDAKVEVNVRVNPNDQSKSQDGKSIQQVKEFIPESWQVVNLPKSSYLIPHTTSSLQLTADSYFDITPKNFETTKNETIAGSDIPAVLHGFSFYTLENIRSREQKKSVAGNYHYRDLRNKNTDGTYNNENGMWEYAPELATYILIKGELHMVVDPMKTTEQHLIADVTYCIHLGNFGSDKDNYDIVRNTHYTYIINIKGVNNIEVEVKTSNDEYAGITENQPGAMGHLFDAEEDSYIFDAHYGQRVYTINANDVDTEHITWYVRTPFGREGVPSKDENGQEVYNDLDYKWVEFMLNDRMNNAGKSVYSNGNQKYPGTTSEKLLTVVDAVKLIKEEVEKWKVTPERSLVDDEGNLKFTVFVNEFYYENNPMNPNDPDILWKKFVNQPNRLMHILCKYNRSNDGDSSVTGSVLTVRQRSIQTPYNINQNKTDLTTGWGCETVDEMNNEAWFYPNESLSKSGNRPTYPIGNTSRTDGLHNTACLLNMVKTEKQGDWWNPHYVKSWNLNKLEWSNFLDYESENRELKLKGAMNAGMYSVFLRNRDLNGDNFVDANELRWYIASLDQLCGLFLGDQGLSGDAQLYPIAARRQPNTKLTEGAFAGVYPWRLHVVSSTAWEEKIENGVPTIVWAEEGASTGAYKGYTNVKPGYKPIRCVRNLGIEDADTSTIVTPDKNYPSDPMVKVNRSSGSINKNSVYKFDFTNMNEESRRYYTTRELVPGDEYSTMSRLYDGFETGSLQTIADKTYQGSNGNNGLKTDLENGISLSPSDYRVPNVREGVVMYLYCDDDWWDGKNFMVNSYYSFGYYGNRYDAKYSNNTLQVDYCSWLISNQNVTVEGSTNNIRFVKDYNP